MHRRTRFDIRTRAGNHKRFYTVTMTNNSAMLTRVLRSLQIYFYICACVIIFYVNYHFTMPCLISEHKYIVSSIVTYDCYGSFIGSILFLGVNNFS